MKRSPTVRELLAELEEVYSALPGEPGGSAVERIRALRDELEAARGEARRLRAIGDSFTGAWASQRPGSHPRG